MTYVDIIAEKTVDEVIVKALRQKINLATQVLGEDWKKWLESEEYKPIINIEKSNFP